MNFVLPSIFLFSVSMLLKIILINWLLFEEVNVSFVLHEIAVVIILFGILEILLFSRLEKKLTLYFLSTFFISIIYVSVLVYNNYYGAIPTFSAFKQVGQLGTLTDSIFDLVRPVYILFIIDFPFLLLGFLLYREVSESKVISRKGIYLTVIVSISVLCVFYTMQSRSAVINEKKIVHNMGVLNNSLYTVLPIHKDYAKEQEYTITQDLINEIKNINPKNHLSLFGKAMNKNVIVVQLEAFQNFPIHKKVDQQEITPNLNKLLQTSYYFPNIFQQIGKGNTADAEFIVNTSLYPVGDQAMSQEYGHKNIPSFPKLLEEKGYTTLTLHTNDVEYWNRDEMYQALGFDQVYDKKFFGTEDVISFGASDEVLYTKTLQQLRDLQRRGEKFYANIIAMSSHHPFKIPSNKVQLNLPAKFENTNTGDYLQAVHYADYALGQFIQGLKENNIWEDVLLVVYGDHYGLQLKTEQDKKLVNEIIGQDYHDYLDAFNIPLIISLPDQLKGKEIHSIGGQVDIMPSMATLLGVSLNQIHFGQDLFNYPDNLLGNRFYLPTGSFINNDILFIPGDKFQDGTAVSIMTKQPVEEFQKYSVDFERVLSLMQISDQYMNSLPDR
ncbi:LTA synthase family protein [Bacillus sp. V3B]|uniref:LTA synthase family protein n=1 Tax=Bacillus sp. V3B TaxID=2804915 RepID=UPI00210CDB83|nr:LTA synthase family protein [Bacillus sp. V3B]MCQ6276858.1 LTA synthase family protein [Bacillus sp. V3B]